MAELLIAAESIVTAAPPDPALSPAPGPAPGSPGYVLIEDGWITAVADGEPPRTPDVDLDHGVLVPGLVDIQINGCFGVDFVAADPAGWAEVSRRLPETGVTAFLPTFITAPVSELVAALRRTAALARPTSAARRVLGVHVEGPFLAANRHGAHDPRAARPRPGVDRRADRRRARAAADAHAGARSGRAGWPRSAGWPRPACWSASGTATRPAAQTERGRRRRRPAGHPPVQRHAPAAPPRARPDRPGAGRPAADLRADRRPAPRGRAGLPVAFAAAPAGSSWSPTRSRPPACHRARTTWAASRSRSTRSGCRPAPDGTIAGSGLRLDAAVAERGRGRGRPAHRGGRGDPAAGRRDRPPRPRPDRPRRAARPGLARRGADRAGATWLAGRRVH